jgi:hypothetical protein
LRQRGNYKKVTQALSEGRTGQAFDELDKLGWIKEVADEDRYKQLASAYLSAVAEKKQGGQAKSALVVSPTHAEGDRITQAIRAGHNLLRCNKQQTFNTQQWRSNTTGSVCSSIPKEHCTIKDHNTL